MCTYIIFHITICLWNGAAVTRSISAKASSRPKPKSVFEHVSPTYHPYGNAPTVTRISHHIYHLLVPTLCAQRPPGSNIISSKTHFSFARLPLHLFRIFKALTLHPSIQSTYLDLTIRCSICELSDNNIVLYKFAVSLMVSFFQPSPDFHILIEISLIVIFTRSLSGTLSRPITYFSFYTLPG